MLTDISGWDLRNDMIKPYVNGGLASLVDSVTLKLLLSDTTLRSFIPPQFQEMTFELHQVCGCEPFYIIHKGTKIDLNIFRTILVTYYQQNNFVRHTQNSPFRTTSAAHYKEKVFPDGECLHANIKDSSQCIACL